MGRAPSSSSSNPPGSLHKRLWTAAEDSMLVNSIQTYGEGHWRSLPGKAGLQRSGRSCRLRWMNYLRPDIKRGNITAEEDDLIIRMHALLGNRWTLIAGRLPGRTDNEIKNYWNTHLSKTLKNQGINPPSRHEKPVQEQRNWRRRSSSKSNTVNNNNNNMVNNNNNIINREKQFHFHNINAQLEKAKIYHPKPVRINSTTCSINSLSLPISSINSEGINSTSDCDHDMMNGSALRQIFGDQNYYRDILSDFQCLSQAPLLSSSSCLGKFYEECLQLLISEEKP